VLYKKSKDRVQIENDNRWEMAGSPDGWPRAIDRGCVAQPYLQKCFCGQWHRQGRTPDACLEYLARRVAAGLELFPGWDKPRKGVRDGDAG
jgi:hypothetical protein